MSGYLDNKYVRLVGQKLDCFHQVDQTTYNARCPICGDSKKSETKSRLYLFTKNNRVHVYCHNCGYSGSLESFLRQVDTSLYQQYKFESIRENRLNKSIIEQHNDSDALAMLRSSRTITGADCQSPLTNAKRIDQLDENHHAVVYVASRKIPRDKWHLLYYVDDFKQFVNTVIPNKFQTQYTTSINKPRLIIPYFDRSGKCFGFQGRALDPNDHIRYITIKIDESIDPIYGLERVDFAKRIYCCEGPIDSLFLPNCLAVSGSHYQSSIIRDLKSRIVIVPDNERRNKQVTDSIEKLIDDGFSVCLWPQSIDFKDINEGINNGYTVDDVVNIINDNIVSGLTGKVKFKLWVR